MNAPDPAPELFPREIADFVVDLGYGITEEGAVYLPAIDAPLVLGKRTYRDVNGDTIYLFDHELLPAAYGGQ